jgi:hypothetical protein
MRIVALALCAAIIPATGAPPEDKAPAEDITWRIETADAAGGGKYSSMRVDTSGNVHVAYIDDVRYQLRYAFRDARLNRWFTTQIDGGSGFSSLALDSAQHPHISYLEYGYPRLKYARWNGSSWETQTLQIRAKNISFYTSIALPNDQPSITYYEYWGVGDDYLLNLRNVSWNGRFWALRTVDTDPGSGKFNCLALDSGGTLHAAYGNVKSEYASLRYARWDGEAWHKEILESMPNAKYTAYSVAIATGPDNQPHITTTDTANRIVKYAYRDNGKWRIEPVDTLGEAAYPDRNGIAVAPNGQVYISYYDAGRGLLKLAHKENGQWMAEVVDSAIAGFTSSLQIVDDRIYISYADERGALKFATRPLHAPPLPVPPPAPKEMSQR